MIVNLEAGLLSAANWTSEAARHHGALWEQSVST